MSSYRLLLIQPTNILSPDWHEDYCQSLLVIEDMRLIILDSKKNFKRFVSNPSFVRHHITLVERT